MSKTEEVKVEEQEQTGIKLTEAELNLINELTSKKQTIQQETAAIGIAQLNLDYRQGQLEDLFAQSVELEKQIADSFTKKYGNGSIDLEKGEFIPA